MNKKYPDNPIVGILAKAIKQDWVQNLSTSEPNNTQDEVNELRCRLLQQEERINELERQVEFLMEFCLKINEIPAQEGKSSKGKNKINLPYPTTYISFRPIHNDTDKEYEQSHKNEIPSEDNSE